MRTKASRNTRGFTLVELLVVITVIVLLFTVVGPEFGGMLKSASNNSAHEIVQEAVRSAQSQIVMNQGEAAVLVDTAHTLRVYRSNNLVNVLRDTNGNFLKDQQVDHISLPGFVQAASPWVALPGDDLAMVLHVVLKNGQKAFLMPPFGIKIDNQGQVMISHASTAAADYSPLSKSAESLIFIGGDDPQSDTVVDLTKNRAATNWTPGEWDPRDSAWNSANADSFGSPKFPIEVIESGDTIQPFYLSAARDAGITLTKTMVEGTPAYIWLNDQNQHPRRFTVKKNGEVVKN